MLVVLLSAPAARQRHGEEPEHAREARLRKIAWRCPLQRLHLTKSMNFFSREGLNAVATEADRGQAFVCAAGQADGRALGEHGGRVGSR